ncbi:MAG: hypothetical protein LBS41_01870 [Streptococcaceae bacterium]|nr:hypothetical protein [Streptococcaceae bacterium]
MFNNENLEIIIDAKMQANFALNKKLQDKKYLSSTLNGRDVNTLIFPTVISVNIALM